MQDYQGKAADAADCATWVTKYGLTFPVVYDNNYQIWNLYNDTDYVPLNMVIDKNFVIRYKDVGFDEAAITAAIAAGL
jgi:hypothetical protein